MSNKKKFIKDVIQQFTVKINQDEANDQLIHSLIFWVNMKVTADHIQKLVVLFII